MFYKSVLTFFLCCISFLAMSQTWGDISKKEGIIFSSVETAPKFPGGMPAFYKFIAESLKFPDDKFSLFSNKSVIIKIVIDETGSPVFAEIEKGLNPEYNKAALAIVPKMPRWSAPLQNGRPVKVWVTIPLMFID